ncbi:hypothetical protein [Paracidovorax avenae]|uniref:hypothetical protein n=1 Tax=Paracidovorax avenae TaxID=80867 RepID=UPI000D20D6A4|nr:hypothetical protein [Paracidovorax avenae]AVS81910.1 hypothetical protein C8237_12965 [Paracidovorax avenae]AVS96456.1 hypothetical protein C8232_09455 [Paracidovorax avenae]AVT03286.1 hypothetical protein C8243_12885 [Paracidovorax avenae]AVT10235.1 hypothetical protein C8242_12645 [Paracidovorax avenae]
MKDHGLPPPEAGGAAIDIESAAFPPLVRLLAVAIVGGLATFALWSIPALRGAQWTFPALATFGLAAVLIGWMGWWMVFSRTRFTSEDGGVIVQTWLWDKRVRAADVASFKIVHWPWFHAVIAPRILLRRKGGGITWVHAADAGLLVAFGESVVRVGAGAVPQSR